MKIAVIGSGIAGLSCAWLLAREGTHVVTLFEQDARLGGHTNTLDIEVEGRHFSVDTGFLVYNDWTYPNLVALFRHLDIATAPSDMSFGIKLTDAAGRSRLEWCGSDRLSSVFAQPANLFKPRFWGMLRDLLRFNRETQALIRRRATLTGTLGDYLDMNGYGQAFRDWYLVPMAACIWSTPTQRIDDFPLATFITFCSNHGLLSVDERPRWRTVAGGARHYVDKLAAALTDIRLGARLEGVTRDAAGVTLTLADGAERFDHVVFACHSDQALSLLADAAAEERDVLGAIPYQANTAILHTDASLLPKRRRAWAAWNYHAGEGESARLDDRPVSLTYLLNRLQPLPVETPVMVTMNPRIEPEARRVLARIAYEHPLFLPESVPAKRRLRHLQGTRRTWFAGAWTRYGFHEDGLMSGIAVARALGAAIPWATDTPAANDGSTPYPGVDTP